MPLHRPARDARNEVVEEVVLVRVLGLLDQGAQSRRGARTFHHDPVADLTAHATEAASHRCCFAPGAV
jgi:hypothetical protein